MLSLPCVKPSLPLHLFSCVGILECFSRLVSDWSPALKCPLPCFILLLMLARCQLQRSVLPRVFGTWGWYILHSTFTIPGSFPILYSPFAFLQLGSLRHRHGKKSIKITCVSD